MFSLKLFGDPLLSGPDGTVTGRAAYRRRLALLGVLAVARGRPVGRERLIGLLWSEHPGEAARHTLSEALYVLRKELGDDLFASVGDEVALNPAVLGSDVAEFEAALEEGRREDAVRAYGGPLLDGFYVSDAPEFERWVDGERDRLARLHARALEELATAAEARGDPLDAAEWWRRLAVHDPYGSRTALRLVRALEAAGERAAALRAAAAHTSFLRQELEVEPDPELAQLVERLRAEPAWVAPPRPAPSAPVVAEPAPEPPAAGEGEPLIPAPAHPSEPAGVPPLVLRRRVSSRTAAYLGALSGILVLAAVLAVADSPAPGEPAAPRYDPRRVAVLYLDDYSPGEELGYLANGLTEMLIHELSQVEGLDVVSRNGVKPYRDHPVTFDSMAADLRAGTVLEGSVQRSGDSVRVTVQVIDANTQGHLESRVIGMPLGAGGLFALQDAVAAEVSGFLRRRVGEEIRLSDLRRRAGSPRALELVLRASRARDDARDMARSPHPRDVATALRALAGADSLLAQAAALERGWAEPVVQRGWTEVDRALLLRGPAQQGALAAALRRAEEALRREAGSVDARELRGHALWRRVVAAPEAADARGWLAGAERDLRAVLAQDGGRAAAWATLSQLLRLSGDLAEAEVAARRAREEDAYLQVDRVGVDRLYRAALAFEDFARAGHWCAEGRREFPDDYRFRECALALLVRDPAAPPRPDSAWRLLGEADRVDPPATAVQAGRPYSPVFRRMMVAAVLARAGLGDSARAVAGRARRRVEGDAELRGSFLWDEAYLHLLLGDRGRAAALLDSFVAARPALREYAAREPAFRGLLAP
ncbi:MAG TPA: BTAD domain-containing putative transcriptional regulator [Longimicrobiaceae bacterium]|nr:BTAD domain-containing putative transcriptional regulator [Longimicrobiaceae bacterium]